jgi:hypothetical protein
MPAPIGLFDERLFMGMGQKLSIGKLLTIKGVARFLASILLPALGAIPSKMELAIRL